MAKRVVKPRVRDRVARKQNDDPGVMQRQVEAVVRFDRMFRMKLPSHAGSGQGNIVLTGSYVQVEGDAFHGEEYPVADGRYRVSGSDWIHTFQGGEYVESEVAALPNYGGPNVIKVDDPRPGNG